MKFQRIVIAAVGLFLFTGSLFGVSPHTWVAYWGSDSNTGASNSPYADFATAITNTAPGGIVSVLTPGDYGPATITQSITIDGTGGGSISFNSGEGISISLSASGTVVLHNLTIDGGGVGTNAIYIQTSATTISSNVLIEGCRLQSFTEYGVGVGSTGPMTVAIHDTVISGGYVGVRTLQSVGNVFYDQVSLDHVTIQGMAYAAVFTRNGNLDISNSTLTLNPNGLVADTGGAIKAESLMVTLNTNGVCIYTTSSATLSHVDLYDNGTAVESCGGTVTGAGGPPPPAATPSPVVTRDPAPDIPHMVRRK